MVSVGLWLILGGCQQDPGSDAETAQRSAESPASGQFDRTPATVAMAELLHEISETARPELCYHLNSRRAAMILERMATLPEPQRGPMRFSYAIELLNAGKTKESIEELRSLLRDLGMSEESAIPEQTKAIYDVLAVAYMRLGEQENCVINHTTESCILPIRAGGVHQLPTGSRTAIGIYSRILESFPDDYQSRYLLNLAYMTLGEYPDAVPTAALIPPSAVMRGVDFPRFVDVAAGLGLDVVGLSGGCCVEDFDNDGFLDVFATSYGLDDQVRLFISEGDGRFTDRTGAAGLKGIVSGLNTVHADYNNDGFEDILVLRGAWLGAGGKHPNSLLRNNGDGTFEDATVEAGLHSRHPTQTAAWGDFNNDGWLDLFIGNETLRDRAGNVVESHPCELYVNQGDGTFREIAAAVGLDVQAFVKGVVWGDIDHDGRPDLYVSVLGGANRLFLNQSGESPESWSFEDIAASAGVEEPFFSFPTWFWDFDNDGDLDLFVSGYDLRRLNNVGYDYGAELLRVRTEAERPRLFRNNGDRTFTDVAAEAGVDAIVYAMGSNFGDLDNDGFLDFYIGTGAPDYRSIVPNKMYWNRGGERFDDVTVAGGFGHIQKGHGVAFGDLDNDGDQDIHCVMGGAYEGDVYQNILFENPGFDGAAWITIDLEGRDSNRSAIGARIKTVVRTRAGAERTSYTVVSTGGSFGSSSLQQEIGLGDAVAIRAIEVEWPGPRPRVDRFEEVALGRTYRLVEGSGELEPVDRKSFSMARGGGRAHHHHH